MGPQESNRNLLKITFATAVVLLGAAFYQQKSASSLPTENHSLAKRSQISRHQPSNAEPKQTMLSDSREAGGTDADTSKAIANTPKIVPLEQRALIAEYRDWSDEQISNELSALEEEVDAERFVERANLGELDQEDMQRFSDLLLTIDALNQVDNERQLAQLEALVNSPPKLPSRSGP